VQYGFLGHRDWQNRVACSGNLSMFILFFSVAKKKKKEEFKNVGFFTVFIGKA
jgi:hypothetical protein